MQFELRIFLPSDTNHLLLVGDDNQRSSLCLSTRRDETRRHAPPASSECPARRSAASTSWTRSLRTRAAPRRLKRSRHQQRRALRGAAYLHGPPRAHQASRRLIFLKGNEAARRSWRTITTCPASGGTATWRPACSYCKARVGRTTRSCNAPDLPWAPSMSLKGHSVPIHARIRCHDQAVANDDLRRRLARPASAKAMPVIQTRSHFHERPVRTPFELTIFTAPFTAATVRIYYENHDRRAAHGACPVRCLIGLRQELEIMRDTAGLSTR